MPETHEPAEAHGTAVSSRTVHTLDRLDNLAHVLVAIFFILMSVTVLVYTGLLLVRQMPLIVDAFHQTSGSASAVVHETGAAPVPAGEGGAAHAPATATANTATAHEEGANPFLHNSLELLSSILFVVIVLELLRTIITYLQSHDIHAIMKEFLVVGIISSVRKILLVGAEASLVGAEAVGKTDKGLDFIKEATGTILSIIGILLLIYGLILLERGYGKKAPSE